MGGGFQQSQVHLFPIGFENKTEEARLSVAGGFYYPSPGSVAAAPYFPHRPPAPTTRVPGSRRSSGPAVPISPRPRPRGRGGGTAEQLRGRRQG